LNILEDTTVDGPGFRTSIYCAGCYHACIECHNPQSWDINNGTMMSTNDIMKIVTADPFAHVTFSGGDPMYQAKGFTELAKAIKQPLHLGITEAGGARAGSVKSAIGLGMLLAEGIGDTLRVSLAADPVEEIKVGFDILKSLRIRSRGINFIACPTCSRQEFDVIGTVNALEQRLEDIITPMDVSIIGCVVNGPGEALVSDLGVTGGNKKSGYYLDGERQKERFDNDAIIDQLEAKIRAKVAQQDPKNRII